MIVYGLDFTSSPSQQSATGPSAKRLTLAKCCLSETTLKVTGLERLNAAKANDFTWYKTWLTSPGVWVGGIDFPFGLPIAAIHHFGWLPDEGRRDWAAYTSRLYDRIQGKMCDFETTVERWTYPSEISEGN